MRKFILSIALVLTLALGAKAQYTQLIADTVQGNETIYLPINIGGSYSSVFIDLDFNELGGTSDGTVTIEVSNQDVGGSSGEWITLDSTYHGQPGQFVTFMNGDSYTIPDDSGSWKVALFNPPFIDARVKIVGTASDTTYAEAHVSFKNN